MDKIIDIFHVALMAILLIFLVVILLGLSIGMYNAYKSDQIVTKELQRLQKKHDSLLIVRDSLINEGYERN